MGLEDLVVLPLMNRIISCLLLACGLSMTALTSHAMAVGDIQLNSHLNQVLDARINILEASQEEILGLKVLLSEKEDNLTNRRSSVLNYEIINNETGTYISISSNDVIREPFVNFNLELSWPEGRLIKEYTLIIDPQ